MNISNPQLPSRCNSIVVIAEDRFLTYNKTAVMFQALSQHFDTELFVVGDESLPKIRRYVSYVKSYFHLARKNYKSDQSQRSLYWLSEFKFTPLHATAMRLISWLHGSPLVGGPHTLSTDSALLTNPPMHLAGQSLTGRIVTLVSKARDRYVFDCLDFIQSYTKNYLRKITSENGAASKRIILMPIGTLEKVATNCWYPTRNFPNKEISIAFWGLASTLHGVELIADAAAALGEKGITLRAKIISADNYFVGELKRRIKANDLEGQFLIDEVTVVSRDYNVVLDCDIAISHLVSEGLSDAHRATTECLCTNKFFEILAMGMPLLTADTKGVREFVNDSHCILVRPGSAEALAEALHRVCVGEVDLQSIAMEGRKLALTKFTPSPIGLLAKSQLDCIFDEMHATHQA